MPIAWGVVLLASVCAFGASYDIKQIADESRVNQDPVISDQGIVLWIAAGTNDLEEGLADVALYTNGALRYLTAGNPDNMFGNVKPSVESNSAVWVAAFSQKAEGNVTTWVLQEVPDRDNGETELPATYRADEIDGVQQLIPVNVRTNGAAATNATPPDAATPAEAPTTPAPESTVPGAETQSDTNNVPPSDERRHPSGLDEVVFWEAGKDPVRITSDYRHDFAPSHWGRLISWQLEKGWPFGWEIMAWDDGKFLQLTTNFYYDMAPKTYGRQIVWYGWDGHDFEIYLHDRDKDTTIQVTSNQFDDVSPVIWEGMIAWEGYPAAEADVYIWKPDTAPRKISDNIEDDFSPRIWDGKVVWQGFDGDDFEIYYFDGDKTVKLTSNLFDDTSPEIRDGLVVWAGNHDNWDAEIYVWPLEGDPQRLTENEYDDRDPRTAGKRIVWRQERDGAYSIYLASPQ